MKWGMQAFDTFGVVPRLRHRPPSQPNTGARRAPDKKHNVYYPDSLVGTDSHTTMINGIGVVGWGVGGIEAEAGMLGQPVYFLTPTWSAWSSKANCAAASPPPTGADHHRNAAP